MCTDDTPSFAAGNAIIKEGGDILFQRIAVIGH
jgi:hypothetical protein